MEKRNSKPQQSASDRPEADPGSNDPRMKQDFPGYPHFPASREELKTEKNWRTDFSNESDTTATGSESIRDERPSEKDNEIEEPKQEEKRGNDRGLVLDNEDERTD